MKKHILIGIALLAAIQLALAWEYSAHTSWNGTYHQEGVKVFTPPATTATLTLCSPVWTSSNPACASNGPWYYKTYARLSPNGDWTSFNIEKFCGGNQYTPDVNVTTNEEWKVRAQVIMIHGSTQYQAQGPVGAYAGSGVSSCYGL